MLSSDEPREVRLEGEMQRQTRVTGPASTRELQVVRMDCTTREITVVVDNADAHQKIVSDLLREDKRLPRSTPPSGLSRSTGGDVQATRRTDVQVDSRVSVRKSGPSDALSSNHSFQVSSQVRAAQNDSSSTRSEFKQSPRSKPQPALSLRQPQPQLVPRPPPPRPPKSRETPVTYDLLNPSLPGQSGPAGNRQTPQHRGGGATAPKPTRPNEGLPLMRSGASSSSSNRASSTTNSQSKSIDSDPTAPTTKPGFRLASRPEARPASRPASTDAASNGGASNAGGPAHSRSAATKRDSSIPAVHARPSEYSTKAKCTCILNGQPTFLTRLSFTGVPFCLAAAGPTPVQLGFISKFCEKHMSLADFQTDRLIYTSSAQVESFFPFRRASEVRFPQTLTSRNERNSIPQSILQGYMTSISAHDLATFLESKMVPDSILDLQIRWIQLRYRFPTLVHQHLPIGPRIHLPSTSRWLDVVQNESKFADRLHSLDFAQAIREAVQPKTPVQSLDALYIVKHVREDGAMFANGDAPNEQLASTLLRSTKATLQHHSSNDVMRGYVDIRDSEDEIDGHRALYQALFPEALKRHMAHGIANKAPEVRMDHEADSPLTSSLQNASLLELHRNRSASLPHSDRSSAPKIHVLSSMFSSQLETCTTPDDFRRLVRGLKRADVDILDLDYLVMPICRQNHWTLAVVAHPSEALFSEPSDMNHPSFAERLLKRSLDENESDGLRRLRERLIANIARRRAENAISETLATRQMDCIRFRMEELKCHAVDHGGLLSCLQTNFHPTSDASQPKRSSAKSRLWGNYMPERFMRNRIPFLRHLRNLVAATEDSAVCDPTPSSHSWSHLPVISEKLPTISQEAARYGCTLLHHFQDIHEESGQASASEPIDREALQSILPPLPSLPPRACILHFNSFMGQKVSPSIFDALRVFLSYAIHDSLVSKFPTWESLAARGAAGTQSTTMHDQHGTGSERPATGSDQASLMHGIHLDAQQVASIDSGSDSDSDSSSDFPFDPLSQSSPSQQLDDSTSDSELYSSSESSECSDTHDSDDYEVKRPNQPRAKKLVTQPHEGEPRQHSNSRSSTPAVPGPAGKLNSAGCILDGEDSDLDIVVVSSNSDHSVTATQRSLSPLTLPRKLFNKVVLPYHPAVTYNLRQLIDLNLRSNEAQANEYLHALLTPDDRSRCLRFLQQFEKAHKSDSHAEACDPLRGLSPLPPPSFFAHLARLDELRRVRLWRKRINELKLSETAAVATGPVSRGGSRSRQPKRVDPTKHIGYAKQLSSELSELGLFDPNEDLSEEHQASARSELTTLSAAGVWVPSLTGTLEKPRSLSEMVSHAIARLRSRTTESKQALQYQLDHEEILAHLHVGDEVRDRLENILQSVAQEACRINILEINACKALVSTYLESLSLGLSIEALEAEFKTELLDVSAEINHFDHIGDEMQLACTSRIQYVYGRSNLPVFDIPTAHQQRNPYDCGFHVTKIIELLYDFPILFERMITLSTRVPGYWRRHSKETPNRQSSREKTSNKSSVSSNSKSKHLHDTEAYDAHCEYHAITGQSQCDDNCLMLTEGRSDIIMAKAGLFLSMPSETKRGEQIESSGDAQVQTDDMVCASVLRRSTRLNSEDTVVIYQPPKPKSKRVKLSQEENGETSEQMPASVVDISESETPSPLEAFSSSPSDISYQVSLAEGARVPVSDVIDGTAALVPKLTPGGDDLTPKLEIVGLEAMKKVKHVIGSILQDTGSDTRHPTYRLAALIKLMNLSASDCELAFRQMHAIGIAVVGAGVALLRVLLRLFDKQEQPNPEEKGRFVKQLADIIESSCTRAVVTAASSRSLNCALLSALLLADELPSQQRVQSNRDCGMSSCPPGSVGAVLAESLRAHFRQALLEVVEASDLEFTVHPVLGPDYLEELNRYAAVDECTKAHRFWNLTLALIQYETMSQQMGNWIFDGGRVLSTKAGLSGRVMDGPQAGAGAPSVPAGGESSAKSDRMVEYAALDRHLTYLTSTLLSELALAKWKWTSFNDIELAQVDVNANEVAKAQHLNPSLQRSTSYEGLDGYFAIPHNASQAAIALPWLSPPHRCESVLVALQGNPLSTAYYVDEIDRSRIGLLDILMKLNLRAGLIDSTVLNDMVTRLDALLEGSCTPVQGRVTVGKPPYWLVMQVLSHLDKSEYRKLSPADRRKLVLELYLHETYSNIQLGATDIKADHEIFATATSFISEFEAWASRHGFSDRFMTLV